MRAKTVQKQAFCHSLPVLYRPFNFPASFCAVAFGGYEWTISEKPPAYLHFHNALEIGYCIKGTARIHVRDSSPPEVCEGTFFLIPPNHPHLMQGVDRPAICEFLYVEMNGFRRVSFPEAPALSDVYLSQHAPVILTRDDQILWDVLEDIFRELRTQDVMYQDVVHGLLLSFFAEYADRFPETLCLAGESASSTAGSIREAIEYIRLHYAEPVRVEDLAQRCCLSESHFRRAFKSVVELSPLDFIQLCRIQEACHLIVQDRLPVQEIAARVGYKSLSSFNRQFQQFMHCSPSEWKHQYLSDPLLTENPSPEDPEPHFVFVSRGTPAHPGREMQLRPGKTF